jgi:hypothetical protein
VPREGAKGPSHSALPRWRAAAVPAGKRTPPAQSILSLSLSQQTTIVYFKSKFLINMSTVDASLAAEEVADGLDHKVANSEEVTASPRVSTVGTDDTARERREPAENYSRQADYTAVGLDHLHWGSVVKKNRVDFDQRSIASSMNAEPRDDKSIYEEPAVGAVEGRLITCLKSSVVNRILLPPQAAH